MADLIERALVRTATTPARTARALVVGDGTHPQRRFAALSLDGGTTGAVLSGNGLLPSPLLPHMYALVR
jgi:hypothetical protein